MNNFKTPKIESKSIINNKAQQCWALNYSDGDEGSPFEHLQGIFEVIKEIYKDKKKEL
ncbi:hypothetical protein [Pedobacter heparinus]|uniref:hypothetical protein n=1 Tax=Pedobacter heparinus TaxID=984 RepID=UPI0029301480|nr:hypothetical protein [Pedobacter heparinus]